MIDKRLKDRDKGLERLYLIQLIIMVTVVSLVVAGCIGLFASDLRLPLAMLFLGVPACIGIFYFVNGFVLRHRVRDENYRHLSKFIADNLRLKKHTCPFVWNHVTKEFNLLEKLPIDKGIVSSYGGVQPNAKNHG